jgi:gluconokinase
MVEQADSGRSAVVACSALKSEYRELLLEGPVETSDTRLVYLRGTTAVLERRLRERRGHFFDPNLLASQLETLEEPEDALVVDADEELAAAVAAVVAALDLQEEGQ